MRKSKVILVSCILSIGLIGCGEDTQVKEEPKISTPSINAPSVSVDIPEPTDETSGDVLDITVAEEVIKNNSDELRKVEKANADIENSNGTLKTKETDSEKLQTADFVKTAKPHNLYCLFEYNGSEEPVITFTSPSGVELNSESLSVIYTPKGEYSLGSAYEIMDAEVGQWQLHYISKGSTIISYSVTDITDFTLNLVPPDVETDNQ